MDMSVKLNAAYAATVAQQAATPSTPASAAPSTVQDAMTPAPAPKREDLEKAVNDIREFVQSTQRQLDFSIDDSTGVVVVKVIATHSGEVIRQLPSETALKLAQSLSDAGSLLFQTNA
ncbi:flagellar protein FlaG [Pseudomonas lundensis]|jgi:flagellar protein FlaG|uniref:Flagellar biosynthesis protein n=1 Tax=Pseudomonas lundensis TaxID=86185 RepID=A0AAX2H6C8_9PSED|nr:flagellar protein FlaG [Pseudomonas lundensis]SOB51795.1 putative flagellar biosynthesis protein [Pseudomonas lundensis]